MFKFLEKIIGKLKSKNNLDLESEDLFKIDDNIRPNTDQITFKIPVENLSTEDAQEMFIPTKEEEPFDVYKYIEEVKKKDITQLQKIVDDRLKEIAAKNKNIDIVSKKKQTTNNKDTKSKPKPKPKPKSKNNSK